MNQPMTSGQVLVKQWQADIDSGELSRRNGKANAELANRIDAMNQRWAEILCEEIAQTRLLMAALDLDPDKVGERPCMEIMLETILKLRDASREQRS